MNQLQISKLSFWDTDFEKLDEERKIANSLFKELWSADCLRRYWLLFVFMGKNEYQKKYVMQVG
ncbi:MAG: hypothetical protein OHK0057_11530 [Thermoflexibacter sp.]